MGAARDVEAQVQAARPSFCMRVRVPEEDLLRECDCVTRLPVLVQVTEHPSAKEQHEQPSAKEQEQPSAKEQHGQEGQPSAKEQHEPKEQVKLMDVIESLNGPTTAYPTVRKLEYKEPAEQVPGADLDTDVATQLQDKTERKTSALPRAPTPSTLAVDGYLANIHAAIGMPAPSTLPQHDKTEIVDLLDGDTFETSIFDALAAEQSSQPPLEFSPPPDSQPPADLGPYECESSQCLSR
ncbi:unnamed protein product [Prorocentrum cordatum]|uniref:Uncharacterized protein n=1 Tax=Prorocentrum cordatum TaxID=2364126 RepID=A0ABN9U5T8_9DINO|nr:unnamed protein product [Polarella glacialis]